MSHFDYAAPAELFSTRSISRKSRVTYRRFPSAAEALRLYSHPDYPLPRKVAA